MPFMSTEANAWTYPTMTVNTGVTSRLLANQHHPNYRPWSILHSHTKTRICRLWVLSTLNFFQSVALPRARADVLGMGNFCSKWPSGLFPGRCQHH